MRTTRSTKRAFLIVGLLYALSASSTTGTARGQAPAPDAAAPDANELTEDAIPSVLELIPDDAALAIAVPNLQRLKTRGDRLLDETGGRGLRVSEVFSRLYNWLDVQDLIDERRPAVALLANLNDVGVDPTDPDNLMEGIVFRLPVDDLPRVAKRFKLDEDDLATGRIVRREKTGGWRAGVVAVRSGYLLMASNQKALESVLDGTPIAAVLTESRGQAARDADVLLLAGTHAWADAWKSFVDEIESGDSLTGDVPQQKEMKQLLRQTVPDTRFVLLTATIDDGVHLRLAAHFHTGGTAEAALNRIREDAEEQANLTGLPQGSLLGAISAKGKELRTIATARLFMPLVLEWLVQRGTLEGNDPSRMLVTVDALREQLDGLQAALYATGATTASQLSDRGMMAGIFVLQTAEPGRLLESIARGGITLGQNQDDQDGQDTESDAGPKARLSLHLVPDREEIESHAIDHLEVDTNTIDADLAATLREGLGPSWMILRAARLENEVLLLMGSETNLLAEALQARQNGGQGLAAGEPFVKSQSRLDAGHQAALYLSLQRTMPATAGFDEGIEEMNSPIDRISSAALTVGRDMLQIELWLPLAEIKAIPEKWQRFW